MKKIYIQPTVQIVNVQTTHTILALSFEETLNTTGGNGSAALSKEEEDWELWDEE